MAKIYWRKIKNGTYLYEDVPSKIKDAVKELALADLENGVITKEEYAELLGEEVVEETETEVEETETTEEVVEE